DRATHKAIWPHPVKITNHGLVLSQPSELPVLVFLRSVYQANNGAHQPLASVLAIDKRTGRTAYKDDNIPLTIHNVEFSGDLADKTVSILLPVRTITLTFTDEEWPAEESAPAKNTPEGGEVGRAIGGIF